MNLSRNQIIIVGIAGIIVLFFVLVFLGIIPGLQKPNQGGGGEEVTINIWGPEEEQSVRPLFDEYQKNRQGVQINYRQISADDYEKTLVNALAASQGPDILMFHNTWLLKHINKIVPISETNLSISQFQQLFPDVAAQDFVSAGKIYALPLYIDTLALLYNKDSFNAKAIALPPKTWIQFQNLIPQLRELNIANQISKPAAAIGGSGKSISQASDLLELIMLQFGSLIADETGRVNFGSNEIEAFNFYLQFANPSSPYYTWNDNLQYSLDSFAQGSTAVIFNYASQIPLIKEKNPFLKIGISPMLQINTNQPINYANYWGMAVSNQSKNSAWAWDFILFATTNDQNNEIYLQAADKPPALRSLIEKYKNNPDLGVFAKQALSAKSWQQIDSTAIKQIFSSMIESVLSNRLSPGNALSETGIEINDLIK